MKELSKLAKFFIICAAVCFVGLVCTIAGVVTGGPQDIDKLADHYEWINGSPGERGVTSQKVEDFHSIEATGEADFWIVGKDFYKKASWLAEQDILEQTELDEFGPGRVCVICCDKVEQPEITVHDGVLTINAGTVEFSGINLNMTEESWYPTVLVCVPDEVLESLSVSGQAADVNVLGAAWESAAIQMNAGDVEMEGVKSGGLTVDMDSGDAQLQGKFMNLTQVGTQSGDVQIDTSLAKAEYALDLDAAAGDVQVGEPGSEAVELEKPVQVNGGPHRLSVKTDAGDIGIRFGID